MCPLKPFALVLCSRFGELLALSGILLSIPQFYLAAWCTYGLPVALNMLSFSVNDLVFFPLMTAPESFLFVALSSVNCTHSTVQTFQVGGCIWDAETSTSGTDYQSHSNVRLKSATDHISISFDVWTPSLRAEVHFQHKGSNPPFSSRVLWPLTQLC